MANISTIKYKFIFEYIPKTYTSPCRIRVTNQDILIMTKNLNNALVLNMANSQIPGGYYKKQGRISGQEEYLFRNTNISEKLTQKYYPLKNEEVIVTKNVRWKSNVFDVISCAAVDAGRYRFNDRDEKLMRMKIETIFQVANKLQYKNLILSALGCGGFNCPPEIIAKIFRTTIQRYRHSFDSIIFCIKDREEHPMSNYNVFKRILVT